MADAKKFINKSVKETAQESVDLLDLFMSQLDYQESADVLDETIVELCAALMTIATIIRMVGYPSE